MLWIDEADAAAAISWNHGISAWWYKYSSCY